MLQCPKCGGRSFKFDHGKPVFQSGQISQYSRKSGKRICSTCGWSEELNQQTQTDSLVKKEESPKAEPKPEEEIATDDMPENKTFERHDKEGKSEN